MKKKSIRKKKLELIKVNLLNMLLGSWDEDKLIRKKFKNKLWSFTPNKSNVEINKTNQYTTQQKKN